MINTSPRTESATHSRRGIHWRRTGSWCAAALVISALGCATGTSFEPLGVTLVDLEITEVTIFETTLVAQLRINNPNPEAIGINGGSFTLYLDEKKIGRGTTTDSFTVERLDSKIAEVVFHINNASTLLRVKENFREDEVSYGVRGSLYTQGTFGTKNLKIEKTGRIDLKGKKTLETDRPDLED